jgi:hypothetical protein
MQDPNKPYFIYWEDSWNEIEEDKENLEDNK